MTKPNFDITTGDGQKRLMAVSMGLDSETYVTKYLKAIAGDYGSDPIGDGTHRMVPSGDIVSYEERCRRLNMPIRQPKGERP